MMRPGVERLIALGKIALAVSLAEWNPRYCSKSGCLFPVVCICNAGKVGKNGRRAEFVQESGPAGEPTLNSVNLTVGQVGL